METPETTTTIESPQKPSINFMALIQAYKVIKEYDAMEPGYADDEFEEKYWAWRNDDKHYEEKCIADRVVLQERIISTVYKEEIDRMYGFDRIEATLTEVPN